MSHSVPFKIVTPFNFAFSASISRHCARTRSGVRPLATVRDCEWSPTPKYSYPNAFAARAISSRLALPSLAVVWLWKTPRMSPGSISVGSSFAAASSISPASSRISGGTNWRPSSAYTSASVETGTGTSSAVRA